MDGWMGGLVDGWMDGTMYVCSSVRMCNHNEANMDKQCRSGFCQNHGYAQISTMTINVPQTIVPLQHVHFGKSSAAAYFWVQLIPHAAV